MKAKKTRGQRRDEINNSGLGKLVHNFHENIVKPGFKRNVDFWKGVGEGMTTPARKKRRGK